MRSTRRGTAAGSSAGSLWHAALLFAFGCIVTGPLVADEADVLAAVERLGIAYRDADVEALRELVTEDYVHTNSSSAPIGRERWFAWVESRRRAMDEGRLRVIEYKTRDLEVVRHGETAIVTGVNRVVRERDGERQTSSVRFTMVWVKVDGAWKRAAFQDCRIVDEGS